MINLVDLNYDLHGSMVSSAIGVISGSNLEFAILDHDELPSPLVADRFEVDLLSNAPDTILDAIRDLGAAPLGYINNLTHPGTIWINSQASGVTVGSIVRTLVHEAVSNSAGLENTQSTYGREILASLSSDIFPDENVAARGSPLHEFVFRMAREIGQHNAASIILQSYGIGDFFSGYNDTSQIVARYFSSLGGAELGLSRLQRDHLVEIFVTLHRNPAILVPGMETPAGPIPVSNFNPFDMGSQELSGVAHGSFLLIPHSIGGYYSVDMSEYTNVLSNGRSQTVDLGWFQSHVSGITGGWSPPPGTHVIPRAGGFEIRNNDGSEWNNGESSKPPPKNDGGHNPGRDLPSKKSKPVLLDLDGTGFSVTELDASTVYVDSTNDGLLNRTAWAGAGDGVLFYDADGNGEITSTREFVFTEWDPTAASDLEALASVFDTNGDGKLTAADDGWADFKVLVTQADGSLVAQTLDDLNIVEIDLTGNATQIELPDGSVITGTTTFTIEDPNTLVQTMHTLGELTLQSEAMGYDVEQVETTNGAGDRVKTLFQGVCALNVCCGRLLDRPASMRRKSRGRRTFEWRAAKGAKRTNFVLTHAAACHTHRASVAE